MKPLKYRIIQKMKDKFLPCFSFFLSISLLSAVISYVIFSLHFKGLNPYNWKTKEEAWWVFFCGCWYLLFLLYVLLIEKHPWEE